MKYKFKLDYPWAFNLEPILCLGWVIFSLNIMYIVKRGILAWESIIAQYAIIENNSCLLHECLLFGKDQVKGKCTLCFEVLGC